MTQAQVHKTTRDVLALGEFPSGTTDPNIEISTLTPAQETQMRQPGSKKLQSDGTVVVTPPPPPGPVYIGQSSIEGRVRTMNDTATEICRLTIPYTQGVAEFDVRIMGFGPNASVRLYEGRIVAKRAAAGALLVGMHDLAVVDEQASAAWNQSAIVSGSDVILQVIGGRTQTVDFYALMTGRLYVPAGVVSPSGSPAALLEWV